MLAYIPGFAQTAFKSVSNPIADNDCLMQSARQVGRFSLTPAMGPSRRCFRMRKPPDSERYQRDRRILTRS
jgi:hypothetical protein